ncbi:MAG TPA: Uma2 family endonuclease [Bacillales bacterium]|nr:Uma2 family endonuclease [Bacillales bacterium]
MGKTFTYDDYVKLPDDGKRYEIDDGALYVMEPAPRIQHQELLVSLSAHLKTHCHPEGKVLISPVDIKFAEKNVKQPDLVFVSKERKDIVKEKAVEGSPDLLVEILSPSTGKRDKKEKKETYERFGVKEYWILDPYYEVLEQFILRDGRYDLDEVYQLEDTITSPHFSCIQIRLGDLFSED